MPRDEDTDLGAKACQSQRKITYIECKGALRLYKLGEMLHHNHDCNFYFIINNKLSNFS